ncbi:hypothetical protein [Rhodoferax sp. BLA1]|uniref:hypothetical protein n=1 Tax=Rhodoferax sp. BLA1 TaxID=2576062 RepID=UPI0015D44312|nr:hypothetical protein [Rhodoferax sp. BLA1]
MANIFVRSTTGSDSNDGLSWATAKATLAGADAIDASGDTIYISKDHVESITGSVTYTLSGAAFSSIKLVLCVDDTGDPATPTSLADTAQIIATGSITYNADYSLVHGVVFKGAAGVSFGNYSGSLAEARRCKFLSSGGTLNFQGQFIELLDCYYGSETALPTLIYAKAPQTFIRGGGLINPGNVAYTLLVTWSNCNCVIDTCDLSALKNDQNIQTEFYNQSAGTLLLKNCKMPDGWTGSLSSFGWAGSHPYAYSRLQNCDSADTNYRLWSHQRGGQVFSETTVVRADGASDGSTPLSWRMLSSGNARRVFAGVQTPEIVVWNEVVGSPVTLTLEILTNGVTLKDSDLWAQCVYLGMSGRPLGVRMTTEPSILSSGVALASSAAAWTTTGITTPIKQKVTLTFTPKEKGFVSAIIKLARADTTVYVCPKLTLI